MIKDILLVEHLPQTLEQDFDDKRKLLAPTLYFCLVFFFFYYLLLVIPEFGINSTIFIVDNIGGAFIALGFLTAIVLAKYIRCHSLFLLPSLMSTAAASLFLAHEEFYQAVSHLWLSAQMIGIIFSSYLGLPTWNLLLFLINVTIPVTLATFLPHLEPAVIAGEQAVVYFASLITIFLAQNFLNKKQQLLQALDKSVKAENAKSEFLANMSHELRTPLNGVMGALQLLQQQPLSPEHGKIINNGLNASSTLLRLINDILDQSKLGEQKLRLDIVDCDLLQLCQEVIHEFSEETETHGGEVTIISELPSSQLWRTDPFRFKQIVRNLLSNALKYSNYCTVEISLKEEGNNILVSAKDEGIGMNEETLSHLFERFSQADRSMTRDYGGAGLGMAISQQIAKLMGGEITAQSEINKGSLICVRLPLKRAISEAATPLATDKTANASGSLSEGTIPNLSGKNILLAEDNRINQMLFMALIKPTNATLWVAEDGKRAVELFHQNSIELVFLDIQMPIMSGVEACIAIRESSSSIPVIAVTANVFEDDLVLYEKSGFDHCLPKPVVMADLYKLLCKYLIQVQK